MASTTLATYKTRVLATLGIPGEATNWDTILTAWLNEGYEDVLLKTRCKVRLATVALTSGETDYSLPTQPLAILSLQNTSGGTTYGFEHVTLPQLRDMQQGSASTSSPSRYYAVSGDLLAIYPAAGTGESLAIDYVPRPTALSAAGDIPSDIPSEYQQLLEWYTLAKMGMAREHQASANGTYWEAKYEKGLREMKANLRKRGGLRNPRAVVGRRRTVSSDPSVITW